MSSPNRDAASRRDNPEAWVAGGHEQFETPMEVVSAAPPTRGEDILGYRELRAQRRREQLRKLTELSEQVEGGYR